MMAKSMERVKTDFLPERKKLEKVATYLPKECVSNILSRLPAQSLQKLSCVCKSWYNMINSSSFFNDYLRHSKMVLIFLSPVEKRSIPQEKPNTFSVEANIPQPALCIWRTVAPPPKYYIQSLEIEDGKSKKIDYNASCMGGIIATCNGLILLENKLKKGVIVMNPVTRKTIIVSDVSLCLPYEESYGFAFSSLTREYKLVHLFKPEQGFVGCEILNLRTRSWKEVKGPDVGLFDYFGCTPVSALGALHWIPKFEDCDYMVSMRMDNEKFYTIILPKSSTMHDKLVEMGGYLTYTTHEETKQMDIWILKEMCQKNWTKQYCITTDFTGVLSPLFGSRIKEEMVFQLLGDQRSMCMYDFHAQVMRKVEMPNGCFPLSISYQPHVNTLVSWCAKESSEDA